MRIERRVGQQHLVDARDCSHFVGSSAHAFASDQHMHRTADLRRCGDHLGDGIAQLALDDIGENKSRHQITPASFLSFDTSSSTEATLVPPLRPGGSLVFRTFSRGEGSTP